MYLNRANLANAIHVPTLHYIILMYQHEVIAHIFVLLSPRSDWNFCVQNSPFARIVRHDVHGCEKSRGQFAQQCSSDPKYKAR